MGLGLLFDTGEDCRWGALAPLRLPSAGVNQIRFDGYDLSRTTHAAPLGSEANLIPFARARKSRQMRRLNGSAVCYSSPMG